MDFDQQAELALHLSRISGCEIRDLAVENALQIITERKRAISFLSLVLGFGRTGN